MTTWRLTVTLDLGNASVVRKMDVEAIDYMEADDVVGDVLALCLTRWPESRDVHIIDCVRTTPGDVMIPARTP
jgi:hypothetical protein